MAWVVRRDETLVPHYAAKTTLFSIEFNHGGKFTFEGDKVSGYVDGLVNYVDYCVPKRMSLKILEAIAAQIGWLEVKKFFFKRVGAEFETDLCEIKVDVDVVNLVNFVDSSRIVQVFAEGCNDEFGLSDTSDDSEQEEVLEDVEIGHIPMFVGSDDEGNEDDGLVDLNVTFEPSSSTNPTAKPKSKVTGPKWTPNTVFDETVLNEGCVDSDDFVSDSDSEGEKEDSSLVFGKADLTNVKFKLGMRFPTADEFRDALKMYCFQNGKDCKLTKNSSKKLIARCFNGTKNERNKGKGKGIELKCTWYLYAAAVRDDVTIEVRTLVDNHSCPRTQDISACKPVFVAKKYMEQIRINPKWSVIAFRQRVHVDLQCKVTMSTAYKAMRIAKTTLQGTNTEQYLLLWDYIEEMKRSNPGTTVVMKVSHKPNSDFAIFRRIYICWGSLKKGFKEGCRPLIGFDGCHLSGPQKGVLLSAVAIDPNNCCYPFCYAVVDIENYRSWKWFLKLVVADLDIENPEDYTIISDKQKGLIKAVGKLFPGIEHRYCVRHLYNNFNQNHKGVALKELLEKAARATTIPQFERALEEMKTMDEEAYNWLANKPGKNWSRSHFSTHTKSPLLLNNLCESFNACIKDFRVKPILSMLESIRLKLMEQVMKKKLTIERVTTMSICPKIRKKLDTLKGFSHLWLASYNGDDEFELAGPNDKRFMVNIVQRTCGCNGWQLTGIPCVHGISCLYHQGKEPEEFVHPCYSIATYKKVYSNVTRPMNGKDLWPKNKDKPILLPPPIKEVKKGRPPKIRRRGPSEPKLNHLSRACLIMKCRKCKQPGHNSRTCGKPVKVRVQGKGIRKKKEKETIQLVDETDTSGDEGDDEADDELQRSEAVVNEGERSEAVVNEGERVEHVVNEGERSEAMVNEGERIEHVVNEGERSEAMVNEGERIEHVVNEGERSEAMVNEEDDDSDGFWADIDNHLRREELAGKEVFSQPLPKIQHDTTSNASNLFCSQQVGTASKKLTPKKPVRRSSRILNSPPKGPFTVDFQDLTIQNEPDTMHAGILKRPKAKSNLPKGVMQKGGKRYITPQALLADMEQQKREKKTKMN